jgi:hypothetical protein
MSDDDLTMRDLKNLSYLLKYKELPNLKNYVCRRPNGADFNIILHHIVEKDATDITTAHRTQTMSTSEDEETIGDWSNMSNNTEKIIRHHSVKNWAQTIAKHEDEKTMGESSNNHIIYSKKKNWK